MCEKHFLHPKEMFFSTVCFHTATKVSINFIFEMNSVVHLPFFHLENVNRTKSWFMSTVHWNIQQNDAKAFYCAAHRMNVHLFLFVSDLGSSHDGWVFYDIKHVYLNNIKSVAFLWMSLFYFLVKFTTFRITFSFEAMYASNYTTFVFFRMPEVLLIFIDWLFFFFFVHVVIFLGISIVKLTIDECRWLSCLWEITNHHEKNIHKIFYDFIDFPDGLDTFFCNRKRLVVRT